MKKYLFILLLLLSTTPLQANSHKCILISSKQLPYVFISDIQDDHINIYCLPSQTNSQSQINDFFDLNISNHVELNLSDFGNPNAYDNVNSLKKYFKELVSSLKPSMLFQINDYVKSDLSLQDYFSLFDLIQKPYPLTFYYPSYLIINNKIYYLDNQFTKS